MAELTIQNPQVGAGGVPSSITLTGEFNVGYATFVDGDATPDISGGTMFRTANTGATSITDFDGNTDCIIHVRSGDTGFTTLVHDVAKLWLKAAMPIAFNAGDSKWFQEDGGIWYEMTNP